MNYIKCIENSGNEASLDVDTIYRVLPVNEMERSGGMVRVIDNEGEDYLYPMRWFEVVPNENLTAELTEPLTVRLNGVTKLTVRDIARRRGGSMASLVREWIEERLDLPSPV